MADRLSDLSSGAAVSSFFVVARAQTAQTRAGADYLVLTLRDATGTMAARVWDPADVCPQGIEAPGVYAIRGRVDSYRDELQVIVDGVRAHEPTHDEMGELVPTSRWQPAVLVDAIRAHIEAAVRAPILRRFLLAVLDHPDVVERLPGAAAASRNHHAYRSGLAEHTLSGMRLATTIADHYARYYPGLVDGDLLVAGFLLHDLGKIWELEGDLDTDYTTEGRLVGHIPMGATFVRTLAAELGDVPQELVLELQHLILAHHGELAYGSPKEPQTIEAQLLHYIDQIDAKTNTFHAALGAPGWTDWVRSMRRTLLEPSELRASWTEPPPGAIGDDGPGTPAAGRSVGESDRPSRRGRSSRASSSPEAESGTHNATKPLHEASDPGAQETSPVEASGPTASADEKPDATLSLFDGLD